ncbi:MAG: OmpA family protein [Bacteroidota bacterium]
MKKSIPIILFLFSISLYANAQTEFKIEYNELVLPSPIVFETQSDKLKPESNVPLQHVVDYLNAKTYITLMRVEAHVSGTNDEKADVELTMKRSLAVCKWLVDKGIDCKRLLPVGFGTYKPVAENSTAEGKAANTRCVFANAELRAKAIGGMPVDGGGLLAGDPCAK